jgi:DNA-binding NtrC family response regulator
MLEAITPLAPRAALGVALCPADGCDVDTLLSGARAAAAKAPPRGLALAADTAVEHTFGDLRVVLADPAMLHTFDLLQRLAKSDLPVLLLGEPGVGKENAAHALHHGSRRAGKELVPVDCAALPDNLVESELFGYQPGAFSDARVAKPGRIEEANGGTLFLDEVGELSEKAQAALLRVLETKRFRRLGDVREREVELRVVAATNRDLEAECRDKRFRRDLFDRLSAATVRLPPLRHRPREIPILARRFLAAAAERAGRPGVSLSEAALHRLGAYAWPGNVRELKNAMEYAAATMVGPRVEIWDLPERLRRVPDDPRADEAIEDAPPESPPQRRVPLADELAAIERERIEQALAEAGGVQLRAAVALGMPIRTLTYKLRQYGIQARPLKRRP